MKVYKTIHLLCNAHLDPVWLWRWPEGAVEALSTFRVAADLCEKHETFIFNHNEAILYKWVEQYDPDLFRRIKKLVKQGRWHIMGGWYLQPDCNMPSGESFVRQILLGKKYFKEKFDSKAKIAINFDPFGHSRGLVQILQKSGYEGYLFGRPDQNDCPLPAEDFIWEGYDGSKVMASRFSGWYNSFPGQAVDKMQKWLKNNGDRPFSLILWGVGNHGGGPSIRDIREVELFISKNPQLNLKHSTPENYFKDIQKSKEKLPVFSKSLNSWAVGCYSSLIKIKQIHRELENEYYSLEKICSTAYYNGLMKYPKEQLNQALEDLMFIQFHDILPGSCVEQAEQDSFRTASHGLEIISKLKTKAFIALSSGQPKGKNGHIPILVYNPHPFKFKTTIESEFCLQSQSLNGEYHDVEVYNKGIKVASQLEKESSNVNYDWRKKIVFDAELEPGQITYFDCVPVLSKKKPNIVQSTQDKIIYRNNRIKVVISKKNGLIESYKLNNKELFSSYAFCPIVMKDNADSWVHFDKCFSNSLGKFKLMDKTKAADFAGVDKPLTSVRIIEKGDVRTVVEALFEYNKSTICQRYVFSEGSTEIGLEVNVYWKEKDSILKISVPLLCDKPKYFGQTVYGFEELASNGNEVVSQKWSAVVDGLSKEVFTVINNGTYSTSFAEKELRLTLLRSAGYSTAPASGNSMLAQDRFTRRMDQGYNAFKFWFNAGLENDIFKNIDRTALIKNECPYVQPFFPDGKGKKSKPLFVIKDEVLQIIAVKKAEKGNNVILRLFEPTGQRCQAFVRIPLIGKSINLKFGAFEIKTLNINMKTGNFNEVDLMENIF